jgi:hypothetical protein
MRGQGTSFARLTQVLGAVAQSGSAPRSHRGGQGFESPQLHQKYAAFKPRLPEAGFSCWHSRAHGSSCVALTALSALTSRCHQL